LVGIDPQLSDPEAGDLKSKESSKAKALGVGADALPKER
jgi:hypothetical protein